MHVLCTARVLAIMYDDCICILCREKEETYMERIKEVERTRQEEALQLQERASNAIKELEEKMEELKGGTISLL